MCLTGVQVLEGSLLGLPVLEANRPQWPSTSTFFLFFFFSAVVFNRAVLKVGEIIR